MERKGECCSVGHRKWVAPPPAGASQPQSAWRPWPKAAVLRTPTTVMCQPHITGIAASSVCSPSSFLANSTPPQEPHLQRVPDFPFPRCTLDPPGGTGHLESTQSPEAVGSVLLLPILFPVGISYQGPSCRGVLPSLDGAALMDAWDARRPGGIVFPPGCTLSH